MRIAIVELSLIFSSKDDAVRDIPVGAFRSLTERVKAFSKLSPEESVVYKRMLYEDFVS